MKIRCRHGGIRLDTMKAGSAIFVFLILLCASLAQAQRLAITAPVANVRSGPATGYDVLWQVEKHQERK